MSSSTCPGRRCPIRTFLVDGFVAGIWTVDDRRVVTEPFAPLPRAAHAQLDEEAGRLEAFVNG